jgi:hypothetical protein
LSASKHIRKGLMDKYIPCLCSTCAKSSYG